MKKTLLVTFISLLIVSCSKESNVLEGEYSLPTQMSVGKVRMYTSTGEITDEAKIKTFLQTRTSWSIEGGIVAADYSGYFHFNTSTIAFGNAADNYCAILFHNDIATADVSLLNARTFGNREMDIVRQGELLILTGGNMEKPSSINGYFNGDNNIAKVNLWITPTPMSVPFSGLSSLDKYRVNLPLIMQGDNLAIPVLITFEWHKSAYGTSFSYMQQWNIVNDSYLSKLTISDTVVVQEGRIILQKQ